MPDLERTTLREAFEGVPSGEVEKFGGLRRHRQGRYQTFEVVAILRIIIGQCRLHPNKPAVGQLHLQRHRQVSVGVQRVIAAPGRHDLIGRQFHFIDEREHGGEVNPCPAPPQTRNARPSFRGGRNHAHLGHYVELTIPQRRPGRLGQVVQLDIGHQTQFGAPEMDARQATITTVQDQAHPAAAKMRKCPRRLLLRHTILLGEAFIPIAAERTLASHAALVRVNERYPTETRAFG